LKFIGNPFLFHSFQLFSRRLYDTSILIVKRLWFCSKIGVMTCLITGCQPFLINLYKTVQWRRVVMVWGFLSLKN